jgi:hypothetical protein
MYLPHRSAHMGHCRTQSMLQRRVPHRSHLARPLRRVQLTKTRQPQTGTWLKGRSDDVRTSTSCFDPVWNSFSKHTDGSMQWIPKQIVTIGEDFHSQVGDGKVRTTLYKVRWKGYDKKDDTWEPITHLQGYATIVKSS